MPPASSSPRILVCGWAGAGNIGDELLTRAVVALLRATGSEPVVASRDPDATRALHGVESVPWGPRGLAAARDVDGACVGPGGIIQDGSSLWSLPGHLVLPWAVRRRGRRVAGIGLGAEPLRRRSSRWLVRRVLASVPVVCRDEASAAALSAAGVESVTAVDLAFGLPVPPVERHSGLVVAIGPHVVPGRLRPASARLVPDDLDAVAPALRRLAGRLDEPIVLACFRGERDRIQAAELARVLGGRAEVAPGDVDEVVRRVAGARAVVASRYHAAVLAVAAGVPVLVRSSESKLASLVAQVDDPGRLATVPDWVTVGDWAPREPMPGLVPGSLDGAAGAASFLASG